MIKFFYAAIMLAAGLGIPTMAALNGGLGTKLHNPVLATCVLLFVGFCFALAVLLFTTGIRFSLFPGQIAWYFYFGGFFVAFYVLSATWIAPRFGVGNAISFVLLGQLIAMSLIDHFGFAGMTKYHLTLARSIGLVFMVIGVFLVVRRSSGTAN